MSVDELLRELDARGIEIGIESGRIWFSPRSAVTPDLAERMKAHKPALLAILRPGGARIDSTDATPVWQAALDRLEGDPLFPPDVMATLRAAEARWEN